MKSHKIFLIALSALLVSNLPLKADLPAGKFYISGNIEALRMSGGEVRRTNNYSFAGHYADGRFLLDMTPQGAEDDIQETAGKDGELIYLIQRYRKPGENEGPRTESVAVVEPSVFSRYASDALAAVLMAFAETNDLGRLTSGKDIFLLGNIRRYPEENNTFKAKFRPDGLDIEATCYGGEERRPEGMVPIQGFENGFKRWTFESALTETESTNAVISVRYERFYPFNRNLFVEKRVTGKIIMKPENEQISLFKPDFQETSLEVHDYRYRAALFPLSKGIADQYDLYWLENHSWAVDTNKIFVHFQQLREFLLRPSTTNTVWQTRLKDDPFGSIFRNQIKNSHRIIILTAFGLFSAGFPGVILLYSWAKRRKLKQRNKKQNDQTTNYEKTN